MENKETIRIVYVEPNKAARIIDLGTDLEDMQRAVGGMIEGVYPFDEPVCLVCNDEGKYNGSLPNRALYDDEGEIWDVVYGPFFICDATGENFGSLTEDQLERYSQKYAKPERFFMRNNRIVAVPYEPGVTIRTEREER